MMTRRRFVAALGAGAAAVLAADAWVVEPRRLEVTRHDVDPAPRAGTRITFAQITDLHLQRVGGLHRRLAAAVERAHLHFIAITGDSVDDRGKLPVLHDFLSLLDPRTPKFAVLGNWEHWAEIDLEELATIYARHGCRLLVNETAVLEHGGARVAVTGLDDLLGGRPDLPAALSGVESSPAHLLLMHCPEYRDRLAEAGVAPHVSGGEAEAAGPARYGFRAMLSGHTHGGQVALAGWAPRVPPGSGRYLRGWYRDGGVPLYVSRGIGTTVAPVRFGAVPELAVFSMTV